MTGFERGDPVVERTTHCRDVHPILRATRYNASHEEGCSRMRTSTFVVVVLLSIIMAGPRQLLIVARKKAPTSLVKKDVGEGFSSWPSRQFTTRGDA